MECHGLSFEGMVWQGSARYNNAVLSRGEVEAFFERARFQAQQDPDEPEEMRLPRQSARYDTIVHTPETSPVRAVDEVGPSTEELEDNHATSGKPSTLNISRNINKPANLFVFGVSSSKQPAPAPFTFSTTREGVCQAGKFCDVCRLIIRKARAIKSEPRKVARDTASIHIEEDHSQSVAAGGRCADVFTGYMTFAELYQSASDGCHLCSLLASPDSKGSFDPPSGSKSHVIVGVYGDKSYDGPGRIEIQDISQQYGRKTVKLQFDKPYAKIQGSLQYKRTDTEAVFSLAQGWLAHCRKDHKLCQHGSKSSFMPTRVLKIETANGKLSSVQLCLTSDKSFQYAPYLALSHCWGSQNIVQLLSKFSRPFQQEVPIARLSRTFQDAALTTARLGFEYLWMDSLCIIQDSPEDKAREIPKMAQIYGGAVLTIAALGSTDSSGGCFKTRNPLTLVPALLRDGDADARDQVWAYNHEPPGPSGVGLLREPLHKRGWVVQERALSPRTLHFGSREVHWECIEATASEARPQMRKWRAASSSGGDDPVFAHEVGMKTALQTIRTGAAQGHTWAQWEGLWWKMVKEYTACQLSRNSDKWNAISALAVEVEECTGMQLYHGLWECNFFEEMLWECEEPGKRNALGPSWSWLSMEGNIQKKRFNYDRAFRKLATAHRPQAARMAADGLGRSRELRIQGRLKQALWETTEDLRTGRLRYSLGVLDNSINATQIDWRWNPDVAPSEEWDLAVLPLVESVGGGESYGLVVRPTDAARLSWVRVGFFRLMLARDADNNPALDFDGDEETIILV